METQESLAKENAKMLELECEKYEKEMYKRNVFIHLASSSELIMDITACKIAKLLQAMGLENNPTVEKYLLTVEKAAAFIEKAAALTEKAVALTEGLRFIENNH